MWMVDKVEVLEVNNALDLDVVNVDRIVLVAVLVSVVYKTKSNVTYLQKRYLECNKIFYVWNWYTKYSMLSDNYLSGKLLELYYAIYFLLQIFRYNEEVLFV